MDLLMMWVGGVLMGAGLTWASMSRLSELRELESRKQAQVQFQYGYLFGESRGLLARQAELNHAHGRITGAPDAECRGPL